MLEKGYKWLIFSGLILGFFACGTPGGETAFRVDLSEVDWAKRSQFKYDFKEPYAGVEEIVHADQSLTSMILDAVESGQVPAFSYADNKPLDQTALRQIFNPTDSTTVFDLDQEMEVPKVVQLELNRSAVKRVRLRQEWYFDREAFTMKARVLAAAPLETIYNSDGSERGDAPLFWVYFNDK